MADRSLTQFPKEGPGAQAKPEAIGRPELAVDAARNTTAELVVNAYEGQDQINERLKALVIDPIDSLPEASRTVRGKVRTGAEIALAIPDQVAFLVEIDQMKQGTFFELNQEGQLVMMDGCKKPYGLGENALKAKMRQTRIVYRSSDGRTQVMEGKDCFNGDVLHNLVLSDAAEAIDPNSILMEKGLPTLSGEEGFYRGECTRMGKDAHLEPGYYIWVQDDQLPLPDFYDYADARFACWSEHLGKISSFRRDQRNADKNFGSLGMLRVNLNLLP